ncbi:hypothetical protein SELMODRAFT_428617 [Selaginella moellendorffii]|uniref:Uncharacterized protein n=1 Tax=Selaginella moellendorffii TaxID=88036 RepID=D8T3F5_SELML|nr:hypothetical protein SELMODRAFT_428617 [Selaginella moellendorffii]
MTNDQAKISTSLANTPLPTRSIARARSSKRGEPCCVIGLETAQGDYEQALIDGFASMNEYLTAQAGDTNEAMVGKLELEIVSFPQVCRAITAIIQRRGHGGNHRDKYLQSPAIETHRASVLNSSLFWCDNSYFLEFEVSIGSYVMLLPRYLHGPEEMGMLYGGLKLGKDLREICMSILLYRGMNCEDVTTPLALGKVKAGIWKPRREAIERPKVQQGAWFHSDHQYLQGLLPPVHFSQVPI